MTTATSLLFMFGGGWLMTYAEKDKTLQVVLFWYLVALAVALN